MNTLHGGVLITNRPSPENIWRLDRSALPMVCAMERVGMRISREAIASLHTQLTEEMGILQSQVERETGHSINLGSGDQLSDLLFNRLRLRQAGKERWTKSHTRLSVDADVLKAMLSQHPSVKTILEWKVREKLRGGYTYSLIDQADENDRIHCDIGYTTAETGRYTPNEPNLTTIPTRTALGKLVRKAFIPSPGNEFGSIDMSQIEPRLSSWDSQCAGMMKVYTDKLDLYWQVASVVYRREFTQQEKEHGVDESTGLTYAELYRQSTKTLVLGILYAISPEGLVDQFLASGAIMFLTGGRSKTWDYDKYYQDAVALCAKAINNFFEGFPEILRRRREHHRRAARYGYAWDMFGRVRYIPQFKSCHRRTMAEGERQAGNFPIQSGAAGVLKLWMAKIWSRMPVWERYGVKVLMCCHDEILCEAPSGVLEEFLPECAEVLRTLLPPDQFNVPLKAAWAISDSWGSIRK